MLYDDVYTDPDFIIADYQTRRREVLYVEKLLAIDAALRGNTGGAGTTGGAFGGGVDGTYSEPIIIGGCFATETEIPTPRGSFNFREIYDRFSRGRREVYSFDSNGKRETDFIQNIWHQTGLCLTMVFEKSKTLRGTARHLLFPAFDEKKPLGVFEIGDTLPFWIDDKWQDLKLLDVVLPTTEEIVWNMRIKKNHSYTPNGAAASNRKNPYEQPQTI